MSVRAILAVSDALRAHERLQAVCAPTKRYRIATQEEIEADAEIKSYTCKLPHEGGEEDQHGTS